MNESPTSPSAQLSELRLKLKQLSQEEFRDHEGMATDYATKVRAAFDGFNSELGLILKGGKINELHEQTLRRFVEKLDELKFLLSKI